jgi:predicted RNA-binding Zn-ribbon protein involved in translation (DUF1610 family)
MDTCPACGSPRVFRSRTRTKFERLRRELTSKRPYRCHTCNWRGWGPDDLLIAAAGDVADAPASPPDLHAIDSALSGAGRNAQKHPPTARAAATGKTKQDSRHRKRASSTRGPGKSRAQ